MMQKQPRELYHLFATELWERFSYYGVTALLVLYINDYLQLPETQVFLIYGAYGTLVYLTSIAGGIISDKLLGPYRAVYIGGVLIALGHFILMLPTNLLLVFYLGLAVIIIGTGLFKPNIATMVGLLYPKNDPRKPKGYILAYMGSNLGTLIAPIVTAFIAELYSWHLAFGIAGLGMLFGLLNFGKLKHLQTKCAKPNLHLSSAICLGLIFLVAIVALFYFPKLVGYILFMVGLYTAYLLYQSGQKYRLPERKILQIVIYLIVFYMIFMTMLQISGGLLNLFTDKYVNRNFGFWHLPTGLFQAVEPLCLIVLSIIVFTKNNIFSASQTLLKYKQDFARALLIMAISFLVLTLGIKLTAHNQNLNLWWLNLVYFLQALAEIFIGPIGLAMLSENIAEETIGLYMGAWVLASAFANFFAAQIGYFFAPPYHTGFVLSDVAINYMLVFCGIGIVGLSFAGFLKLLKFRQNPI
jgi:POT family proton-dependent oligopeptide transporter